MRVGRFSDVSDTILSPTAFPPGGPHFTAHPVTLSHFCSSPESASFHIFSRANTSFCPRDFLRAFLCNSIVRFATLPLVDTVIYFISGNHLKYDGSSPIILCISSVRVPTGHSIEYVITLLSSLGNISTPTFGARKINPSMNSITGTTIESRLRKVFLKKYVNISL